MINTVTYNNQRLGVPIPYDTKPSFDTNLYNEGYKIIQPYIQRILKLAYQYEESGDIDNAKKFYRDVNYFVFILNYLFIIYRYKKLVNQNPTLGISGEQINTKYKVDCVYKGLSCTVCKEPIQQAFRDIVQIFGLNDVYISDDDSETCVGIGKMIIGESVNDFTSFIINNICYIKTLNNNKLVSSFDLNSFDSPSFEQTQY